MSFVTSFRANSPSYLMEPLRCSFQSRFPISQRFSNGSLERGSKARTCGRALIRSCKAIIPIGRERFVRHWWDSRFITTSVSPSWLGLLRPYVQQLQALGLNLESLASRRASAPFASNSTQPPADACALESRRLRLAISAVSIGASVQPAELP